MNGNEGFKAYSMIQKGGVDIPQLNRKHITLPDLFIGYYAIDNEHGGMFATKHLIKEY